MQGPELDSEGLQLGVVTAIAAPAALRVQFSGDGGHAGAQLMPLRCAPDLAACLLYETGKRDAGAQIMLGHALLR